MYSSPPVFLPLPELSRVVMFYLGIDGLVFFVKERWGRLYSVVLLSLPPYKKERLGRLYSFVLLSLPP